MSLKEDRSVEMTFMLMLLTCCWSRVLEDSVLIIIFRRKIAFMH